MATYHVAVVPRRGEHPDPRICPLVTCYFTADSEDDELEQAEALIVEKGHVAWERALEAAGGDEGGGSPAPWGRLAASAALERRQAPHHAVPPCAGRL